MIRDYKEGAKVTIDDKCLEKMEHRSKWTCDPNNPSDSYRKTAKSVKGLIGIVTKRFYPSYEFNVEWDVPYVRYDGSIQNVTILQVKDSWVKPLDNNYITV